jgi:hypothetical protein
VPPARAARDSDAVVGEACAATDLRRLPGAGALHWGGVDLDTLATPMLLPGHDLVPQHQDLDVLGRVGPGEQHKPAQHASEHEVGESEGHNDRSVGMDGGLRGRSAVWPQRRWEGTMSRFSARTGAGEQRQPAQYANEQQVDESEGHSR